MPFAAMPEQVGVEGIFGMSDISEVQLDAALLLCVLRIAIAYRALSHHRADFLLEPLPGFHCIKVESPNDVSTFLQGDIARKGVRQISRLRTLSAFSSINWRRGST